MADDDGIDRTSREEDREEAQRPLTEAGQGVAEGFEEAERELIEHSSHGDEAPDPTEMAGDIEAEESDAEYGEADHEKSSERDAEGEEGGD